MEVGATGYAEFKGYKSCVVSKSKRVPDSRANVEAYLNTLTCSGKTLQIRTYMIQLDGGRNGCGLLGSELVE